MLDILLPFWGDPDLLRRTVASVQSQTSDEWRLTVVDDAYPDDSVAAYFATLGDSRVHYVRNDVNVGITENFRRCLALAETEMVVFLGCDDILLPHYVETVLEAHRRFPEADIIQPGVEVIDEDDRVTLPLGDRVKRWVTPHGSGARVLGGESLAASLVTANWLYWPSLVLRRAAVDQHGFRDGLPIILDLALVLDILAAGGVLLYVPDVCFRYRRHSNSLSSATAVSGERFDGERLFFALAAAQARRAGWPRAARAARWHLSSRALALTLLPRSMRVADWTASRGLFRFAFGLPEAHRGM